MSGSERGVCRAGCALVVCVFLRAVLGGGVAEAAEAPLHLDASGVTAGDFGNPAEQADEAGWSAQAVTLATGPGLPVSAHAGYDFGGRDSAGRVAPGSWTAGGAWPHPFGTGQTISYDLQRGINGRFASRSFSDTLDIAGDRQIRIAGSYASSQGEVPSQDGYFSQESFGYVRHDGAWESRVTVFVASADMGLAFNTVFLLPGAMRMNEVSILCNETERDGLGRTEIAVTGAVGSERGQAAAPGVAAGGSGYGYERLDLSRSYDMPGGASLITALRLQVARGGLFDQSRLDAGDLGAVYMHAAGLTPLSEGVMTGQQMTGPAADLGAATGMPALDGNTMRGGVFWSYASLRQPWTPGEAVPPETVATAGVSLECGLSARMKVAVHLGWQAVWAGPERRGPFGQAALSFTF